MIKSILSIITINTFLFANTFANATNSDGAYHQNRVYIGKSHLRKWNGTSKIPNNARYIGAYTWSDGTIFDGCYWFAIVNSTGQNDWIAGCPLPSGVWIFVN